MFKILFSLFKLSIFAAIILIMGNLITWDGKTISDQIETQMAHPVSKPLREAKSIAGKINRTLQSGLQKAKTIGSLGKILDSDSTDATSEQGHPDIPKSERQKLQNLIEDLNNYHD